MTTTVEAFFAKQESHSRVKSRIVSGYFVPRAKIVGKKAREKGLPIAYFDLFSGPGAYDDGSESTPLLVLRAAIAEPQVRELLVARFNDADPENCRRLRDAIGCLPGLKSLRRLPRVDNHTFTQDIGRWLGDIAFPPSLFFIDPFGYKGLTQNLIENALKDWGCEIIFSSTSTGSMRPSGTSAFRSTLTSRSARVRLNYCGRRCRG